MPPTDELQDLWNDLQRRICVEETEWREREAILRECEDNFVMLQELLQLNPCLQECHTQIQTLRTSKTIREYSEMLFKRYHQSALLAAKTALQLYKMRHFAFIVQNFCTLQAIDQELSPSEVAQRRTALAAERLTKEREAALLRRNMEWATT